MVSDIPENLEVLHGHGYQFRVGDVTDLAARLQWLLDHPAAVQADREQTRHAPNTNWDWSRVGQATLEAYKTKLSLTSFDAPRHFAIDS